MDQAEQRQMSRKHIFAVNGAAEFLDFLRALLQEEDYNVTTTNFVPKTYDQIAALGPDLIIVDLVIAQQAGWNLLERLHQEATTRGIPVIVTSTDQRLLDEAQREPERFGGQRFIVKPMDVDELLEAVRELTVDAESKPSDR